MGSSLVTSPCGGSINVGGCPCPQGGDSPWGSSQGTSLGPLLLGGIGLIKGVSRRAPPGRALHLCPSGVSPPGCVSVPSVTTGCCKTHGSFCIRWRVLGRLCRVLLPPRSPRQAPCVGGSPQPWLSSCGGVLVCGGRCEHMGFLKVTQPGAGGVWAPPRGAGSVLGVLDSSYGC